RKPAESLAGSWRAGQFQLLPLNKTTKARRGTAWGDVNADQRADLVVAEPDSGQITVYLQKGDGQLGEGRTFPTLTGVSDLLVAPAEAGAPAKIYLLSPDERLVGVTAFDPQGRLPFPTTIPTAGKPLAMGFGRLQAGAPGSLAVILDQETNRVLVLRSPDGSVRTRPLGANFKSNPTSLRFHDLDHDGLNDVLILIPYEKIKVLLQGPGAEFTEVDVAPPGGTTEQPWAGAADVDGDGHAELLLGQKNFVRAVVLQAGAEAAARTNWTFRVKDQINGAAHNSRIVGVATLHPATNAVPAVFLLDAERKALTLCERDSNGVWQVLRNVPLPFTEFTELQAIALGHSAPNSIAFLGLNAVGWMPTAGDVWEVSELDGYETPIEDGHLHDVVSGDLNQDGRKDLVFLETAKNHLDVVIFAPPHQLVPAIRWPVFEERTFRGRRGDNAEPREALIEDFTGDGKADLAVVVHDRILIYPQE
ncbi:MAG TPA: VCBS repeat-containing protein, partial [Methylomirabilota bacterium]|nr:VCBS repeat-containing protein [Methylomirabilota bacterium]